jgi:hypothetical protein
MTERDDELPDTSRKARADNAPRRGSQAHRIVVSIESESAGLTRDELVERLSLPTGSVQARVNELAADDWITDTVKLRPTTTGSDARVLVVTAQQWRRRVLVEAAREDRRSGESTRDALLRLGWVKEREGRDLLTDDDAADPRTSRVLLSESELHELETVATWIAEARREASRGGTPSYRTTYTVLSDALDGLSWLVNPEAVQARAAQARARQRWSGLSITAAGRAELAKHEQPAGVFESNDAPPEQESSG